MKKKIPLSTGLLVLFTLLSFLYMFHAAVVLSKSIGPYHDELWDFIPAVSMIRAESLVQSRAINIFGYHLPIVSSPYSGAIKIWLSAPLLLLFGTSIRFLLGLNVLFGTAYLLTVYWALLPAVGRKWALVVFALPFVDTNFLVAAPMDVGLFLFQCIFISLAIGALFRYVSSSRANYYCLTWFFIGCTLAHKLTSIPIAVAIAVALTALALQPFLREMRERNTFEAVKTYVAVPTIWFVVPLLPQLLYFQNSGFSELFAATADGRRGPYFATLGNNLSFFCNMFDGVDWYRRITVDFPPQSPKPTVFALAGLSIMACSLILQLVRREERNTGRCALVSIGISVCSFLIYPAIRGLVRPWHIYVLAPAFIIGLVTSAAFCLSTLKKHVKHEAIIRIAVCIVVVAGAALGAMHASTLLNRFETRKGMCLSSPAFYDFYAAIMASKVKKVYAVNYSLAYPIYVLSKGVIRVEDLAWTTLTREKITELFERIKSNPDAAIAYRYCACKDVDETWITWLNREPEIFELINRLKEDKENLSVMRCKDERQTELVLIRRSGARDAQGRE